MNKKIRKIIYWVILIGLLLWAIGLARTSNAESAFLNITPTISNTHGGSLGPSDFSYQISFDGSTSTLSGVVQGYGFPGHDESTPLIYSVIPVNIIGYDSKLGDQGCSGIINSNKSPLITCTVYETDNGDQKIAQVVAPPISVTTVTPASSPGPSLSSVADALPVLMSISSSTDDLARNIALQEEIISLLKQLIELLTLKLQLQAVS